MHVNVSQAFADGKAKDQHWYSPHFCLVSQVCLSNNLKLSKLWHIDRYFSEHGLLRTTFYL